MADELTHSMTLTFTYTEADVISAHRLHFRHSKRIRLLGAFGLASFAVTAAARVSPGLFGSPAGLDWFMPVAILAVFIAALLVAYLLLPGLDYRRNPIWRPEYTLRVDEAGLKLARPGAARDFEVPWPYVSAVLENTQVFMLFFGGEQDYLVAPKRAFGGRKEAEAFRNLASSR